MSALNRDRVITIRFPGKTPHSRPRMSTPSLSIIPPAPKVHAGDLPVWRLLLEFTRNTVSTMPDYAFDTLISRRRVLNIDTMLVNDPDGVRHVLTANVANYVRPMATYRVFRPLAGQGLFLAEGTEWRRQRRMLAPVFTPVSFGSLFPHFVEAAADLVRQLEGAPQANLSTAFQTATLEAVLRALFTLPESAQRGQLAAMVRGYFTGPGLPNIFDGFAKSETAFGFATRARSRFRFGWTAAVDAVVAARRQAPVVGQHRDMLDLLLAVRDPETGRRSATPRSAINARR